VIDLFRAQIPWHFGQAPRGIRRHRLVEIGLALPLDGKQRAVSRPRRNGLA
jgi:hypothetical protein